jgi:hypothetical protein
MRAAGAAGCVDDLTGVDLGEGYRKAECGCICTCGPTPRIPDSPPETPYPPILYARRPAHREAGRRPGRHVNRTLTVVRAVVCWALDEDQVASPLVRRPHDLRHGAASLWLNSGVPITEVARRLGHSVAVLLKVYANCVDGEEQTMNGRVESALGSDAGDGTLGTAADQSRTESEESDHGPDETAA